MPNSDDAAETIRSRIVAGRLPRRLSTRIFAGPGDGSVCACCDRPIEKFDVQYELDGRDGDGQPPPSMHIRCFNLWRIAVGRLAQDESALRRDAHDSRDSLPTEGRGRAQ